MDPNIHPVHLLLVHSCVASALLFCILRYQLENGNSSEKFKDPEDFKTLATAGFPLFLFNIAWIFAIAAIIAPYFGVWGPYSGTFADLCAFLTALAIPTAIIILLCGEFFDLSRIDIRVTHRKKS